MQLPPVNALMVTFHVPTSAATGVPEMTFPLSRKLLLGGSPLAQYLFAGVAVIV